MLIVGNEELAGQPGIRKGDIIIHTHENGTEEEAVISYGTDSKTGEESPLLAAYTLSNGTSYIAGINGTLLKSKSLRKKG